jgi:ABC-2 type transport system ATP-binding protein
VLVLDEPTAGLDPQARRGLRALIKELRSEGRTILLSTHDLEEAAQLCDEVAIMDRGRIVALGPPDELIGRAKSPTRVVVRTAPPLAGTVVSALPDVAGADCCEDGWILETSVPTRLVQALVRLADESGSELVDVHVRRPSLEDVFIEVTGHSWPGGQIDGEVA